MFFFANLLIAIDPEVRDDFCPLFSNSSKNRFIPSESDAMWPAITTLIWYFSASFLLLAHMHADYRRSRRAIFIYLLGTAGPPLGYPYRKLFSGRRQKRRAGIILFASLNSGIVLIVSSTSPTVSILFSRSVTKSRAQIISDCVRT